MGVLFLHGQVQALVTRASGYLQTKCRYMPEFADRYHTERSHQGIGNNIIDFKGDAGTTDGTVQRRERLGGMLNY